jgi:hypothetical protein
LACISQIDVFVLAFPMDVTLAPKHVAVFKTYVEFVIVLCASGGECD